MEDSQWPDVVHNVHHLWTPVTVTQQHESYFVYVPITKCASTYLRNAVPAPEFDSSRWQFCQQHSDLPVPEPAWTQWFVVLRDPWSRWLSGATHWLSYHQDWQAYMDQVTEQIEMDAHTCPQYQFLTQVDSYRTVFMRYQTDIGQHQWFRRQGWKLHSVLSHRRNVTERTDIQRELEQRISRKQIHRVKDYYHEDYELIRTARFI